MNTRGWSRTNIVLPLDSQIFHLGIQWRRMRRTAGNMTMQYRSSPSFKDVLPSRNRLLHMNLKIQNIRDVSCFVITRLYELWSHGWGLTLFWDVTLRKLVFGYRRFAIICRSIFNVQAVIMLVLLWNLEMGTTGWPGTSVNKYHLTPPSWTATTPPRRSETS